MAKLGDKTFENRLFNGPISTYVAYLYEQFSVNPLPESIKIPNEYWKPFIQLLYKGNNQTEPEYEIDSSLIPNYEHIDIDTNKFILAFSGGKDSTANLLYLMDEGYDVTCVFNKGIKRSATGDLDHAKAVTNYLNLDLVIDEISISGKTDYFEHPVNNILIISRLLEYGFNTDCAYISIGETHNLKSEEMDIMYNYSDAIDLLNLFEQAVQTHYPQFRLDWIFKEESTDISYILHNHPDVIPLIHSCLMPSRYRKMQLKYIEKFNLKADIKHPDTTGIMEGRCMNCWKCMAEWLYLVVWGLLPMDRSYLQNKVIPTATSKIGQLDKSLEGRTDLTVHDVLEALVEIDTLKEYVKDPSKIDRDSYHKWPELNRKRI